MSPPPLPTRWFAAGATEPAALRPDGTVLSGAELDARIRCLAARLRRDGAGGRDRVVATRDRAEVLACVIACAQVGDVAVLPGMMAPEALRRLGEQVGSVLSDRPVPDDERVLVLDPEGRAPAAQGNPLVVPPAEAPLVRLSTSGSTGSPRTITKTTGQLLGEASALSAAFDWPDGPVLCTVPAQHIYGLLFGVLVPIQRGLTFTTDTARLPGAVTRRVAEIGARTLVAVPAQLRTFADPDHGALRQLGLVTSSGAPLPAEVARAWHAAFGGDITEVYGSTETGGIAWRRQRIDDAWRPLPGVEPTLDDDGRLHVDAPWLPPRAPRPFRTDDLASPTARGGFVLRGRADAVVKVAGKRVGLTEVLDRLSTAPGVEDAALVARPDPVRGSRLEALIVPAGADLSAVRAHLGRTLDRVAWPRLVAVDALPRNEAGKLPRAAILDTIDRATGRALTVDELVIDGDRATAIVRAPERGPWFDGHLPGMPVVPGVGLLDRVVAATVRRAWPELGRIVAVPRVRFQQPVRPGDRLSLALTRRGHGVQFVMEGDGGVTARGRVLFAG